MTRSTLPVSVIAAASVFGFPFDGPATVVAQPCELTTSGFLGVDLYDVARADSTIYALGGLGLMVIDASDLSNLEFVKHIDSPTGTDIAFDDGYVYIVGGDTIGGNSLSGLFIYDASDPHEPTPIAHVEVLENPGKIAIDGDVAFVTNRLTGAQDAVVGLYLIDIADPSNPSLLSSLEIPQSINDIAVSGDVVVLGMSGFATTPVIFVDVSDPTDPQIASMMSFPVGGPAWGMDVVVDGDIAYLSTRFSNGSGPEGLTVIDFSDAYHPQLLAAIEHADLPAGPISISDGHLFQAFRTSGVAVYDVTIPADPTYVMSLETVGAIVDEIMIEDGVAVVADGGVAVYDVSSPNYPQTLDRLEPPLEPIASLATSADVALVTDDEDPDRALTLIDMSDPTNPNVIQSMDLPGRPRHTAVNDNLALITMVGGGMLVVDISDAANPTHVASLAPQGFGYVVSRGELAIATTGTGIAIISVADPDAPFVAAELELEYDEYPGTPGAAAGLAMNGNFVYVARRSLGLMVVDISDPANPELVRTLDTTAERVAVCGDLLAVGRTYYRVEMYNIADPANPIFVGDVFAASGRCWDIEFQGTLLYRAGGNDGMQVIDVSDPTSPAVVSVYLHPIYEVARIGTATIVTSGDEGLHAVDATSCGQPIGMCPPAADPPAPPPPSLGPSDLNGDGFVNGVDLAILLSAWGGPNGDLTNDGTTNGADLAILLANWS